MTGETAAAAHLVIISNNMAIKVSMKSMEACEQHLPTKFSSPTWNHNGRKVDPVVVYKCFRTDVKY